MSCSVRCRKQKNSSLLIAAAVGYCVGALPYSDFLNDLIMPELSALFLVALANDGTATPNYMHK